MVPLAAGSGMDSLVRIYADKLQQSLGKPVVVENRPGAALMLAAAAVAQAPADGYTLLVSTSSAMAINPVLYKKINYDHVKDFVPISLYVKSPFILVVNPDLPVKSVSELIKLAKASKEPLTFSLARRRRRTASFHRIHEAALRARHDARALQEHAAIDLRHRRRPCANSALPKPAPRCR